LVEERVYVLIFLLSILFITLFSWSLSFYSLTLFAGRSIPFMFKVMESILPSAFTLNVNLMFISFAKYSVSDAGKS